MDHSILQLLLAVFFVRVSASANITTLPALPNFSDPAIIYDNSSATWFAFSTSEAGKNVPVASSNDFIQWYPSPNDSLPSSSLPTWAKADGPIWAPDVSFVRRSNVLYGLELTIYRTVAII